MDTPWLRHNCKCNAVERSQPRIYQAYTFVQYKQVSIASKRVRREGQDTGETGGTIEVHNAPMRLPLPPS
jgi:hypothetical protein